MIVDNFDILTPFIRFGDNRENIILVLLLKRSKDGHKVSGPSKNRTIKSYHFQSLEQFEKQQDEIRALCNEFKCRAYICLNPKPVLNVLFSLQGQCIEHIREMVHGGQCVSLKGILDSAVAKSGGDVNTWWVVDIDTNDIEEIAKYREIIDGARSGHDKNIIMTVDTAHGKHFITHPFDTRVLEGSGIEIKKECLTLLYANVIE